MSYFIRRVFYAVPILLGVSFICFMLVHLAPGDPLASIMPPDASAELRQQLVALYGFDQPVWKQFGQWLWRALQGDLGTSIATARPVALEIFNAVGNTLRLALAATIVGFVLGALFGFLAGYCRGTWIDRAASCVTVMGVSLPHYWVGMCLVIVFSTQLMWLPPSGAGPGGSEEWVWDIEHMQYLVLPVITMALIPMSIVARTIRALVAEMLTQEFIVGLRARGLGSARILMHVAKNCAPTAIAVMGLQLGYLLGGSILIETVFSWPGSGSLLNQAIFQRDLPLLQGSILVLALFFVSLNLLVDVLQPLVDPRIERT